MDDPDSGADGSATELENTPALLALLLNTTVTLALLTAIYYTVPLRMTGQATGWVRVGISVLLFVGLVLLFRAHVHRTREREGALVKVEWLLAALYVLVLAFAMAYAVTTRVDPDQFEAIHDRTDALYFSVTLVATVGLGDIHPTATFGKLLTTGQMLFDVVYIGTSVRILSARASQGGFPGPAGPKG